MAAPQPPPPPPSQAPSSRLDDILSASDRIEELSDASDDDDDDDDEYEDMGTVAGEHEAANIAFINAITPPVRDALRTASSAVQDETLEAVLPFLEGNPNDFPLNVFGLPQLQRQRHVAFLERTLGDYPAPMTAMDAARPWLLYWSLQGLTALGEDVSPYRERVIATFMPAQHPDGGFGGGYGHLPHLACTYAAVLSLVMVGGEAAYESVDRRAMWQYLGRMKQADGGFTMAAGGEEDIRGAYCALVALSLLNLPLELPADAPARLAGHATTFLDGLGPWISRCQTYEGGISAAPGNEAHGAYAFCGLGCLSIMGPPRETLNRYLDVPLLVHCLSSRHCAPECGYQGRTNKLVDGCYSHWIGGCWALVEAAAGPGPGPGPRLWDRSALARYILSAAQFKRGGMLDKPGKRPDGYHTCYNLAGLSAVQHEHVFDGESEGEGGGEGGVGKGNLGAPYRWRRKGEAGGRRVWGDGDAVGEVHPVFVVPTAAAMECRRYFEAKGGF